MTTVAQITVAVRRLPKRELAKFRKWFVEFDAAAWDREFEEDVAAGRLDALAREALLDDRAAGPRNCEASGQSAVLASVPRVASRGSATRRS
jgi:hypothetical protein